MECPTCGYAFDPSTAGMQCPRCGEGVSCAGTPCAECDACEGILEQLRQTATDRLRADGGTE